MTEVVTVTPAGGIDSDGNPATPGTPVTLTPLEIAPGNLMVRYGQGGDLTDVEFTVYLPLRVLGEDGWIDTDSLITNGDVITVRGRDCTAMVQVWKSQRGARGGIVVLARSKTGKAA